MIKTLPNKTVVIVGGGLSAGLLARQITGQGVEVLVLERGIDHTDGAEARLPTQRDELRWDIRQGLMQRWNVQTYTMRHERTAAAAPIRWMEAILPGEGLGGAGNHWNGHTYRWAEYDMNLRSHYVARYGKSAIPKEMPLQDWGVSYRELEPYHDLFEALFGVGGVTGNLNGVLQAGGNPFDPPRSRPYVQGPLEQTHGAYLFKAAAEKMGYHPFATPAANSSAPYTNRDGQKLGQCQYCGHCERFICEARAKGSPDVLLYPMLRERKQFELRLRCHVLGVIYDREARRVRGVRYVDLASGQEYDQPADVVVLAAFTMTNAKLLMMAGIGEQYDPATGHGVVGKNFCYQTNSGVQLFFKDEWLNPFMASGSTAIGFDDLNNDNYDHTGLGFLGGGLVSASTTSGRPIKSRWLPPGSPLWGSAWKKANADWYSHAMSIGVQGSCYPHAENFLDLDPTYKDAYGQPLVRMTFDWRANEEKMSAYTTARAEQLARTMGATIVAPGTPRRRPFDSRVYQGTHITGGTVMGADPRTSVVSHRLQHWNAENLFVVGASVFAHNSGYNPTGPLAALALRLGDDVADYAKRPRVLA
jgi:gluconate 2-dehydrogenase alpha chain